MANFDEILAGLKNDVIAYAESQWKDMKNQAVADGNAFVQTIKADLQNWTAQLAAGKLTQDDVKWLVQGKKDLAVLESLKLAGLAQARRDQFVNGLVVVVANAALKAV